MGYKVLGVLVWRGARWYIRRKHPDAPRRLLIGAGAASAVVAGVAVVAARQRAGAAA